MGAPRADTSQSCMRVKAVFSRENKAASQQMEEVLWKLCQKSTSLVPWYYSSLSLIELEETEVDILLLWPSFIQHGSQLCRYIFQRSRKQLYFSSMHAIPDKTVQLHPTSLRKREFSLVLTLKEGVML